MRKLQNYVAKYGPEIGPKFYHVLQSQAAHAGVAARLRRKIESIKERTGRPLPLFPERPEAEGETRVKTDDARPALPVGR